MINHNFPQLNLYAHTTGTQTLPFENKNIHFNSNLKNFLVTAYREYTYKSIKATSKLTGGNIILHSKENARSSNQFLISSDNKKKDKTYDYLPFFILKLTISSQDKEISNEEFAFIQQNINNIASYSDYRNVRGNRGVFTSEFSPSSMSDNEFECFIFISRAVFYNDYRVTVNFPASSEEYKNTTQNLTDKLGQFFSHTGLFSDFDCTIMLSHINP